MQNLKGFCPFLLKNMPKYAKEKHSKQKENRLKNERHTKEKGEYDGQRIFDFI